jgi:hypothetical protein
MLWRNWFEAVTPASCAGDGGPSKPEPQSTTLWTFLGSRKAVEHVNTILREGTGADRQLNTHREYGTLRAVVDRVCEETLAGFPATLGEASQ